MMLALDPRFVTQDVFTRHLEDPLAHPAERHQRINEAYPEQVRHQQEHLHLGDELESLRGFQNKLLGGLILLSVLSAGGFGALLLERFAR